jgi:hypothetical protein
MSSPNKQAVKLFIVILIAIKLSQVPLLRLLNRVVTPGSVASKDELSGYFGK